MGTVSMNTTERSATAHEGSDSEESEDGESKSGKAGGAASASESAAASAQPAAHVYDKGYKKWESFDVVRV